MKDAEELVQTIVYRCPECDVVATSYAWDSSWWEKRAELMRDPDVKIEVAGRSLRVVLDDQIALGKAATERMLDSMVCPRCGYHFRDGNDEAGPTELLADIALETVRERS